MRTIQKLIGAAALLTVSLCAADLIVQRATVWGPGGSAQGKLVIRGEQLTFVDDNNPDMSFIIPKRDVKSARWEGGKLSIALTSPYSSSVGENRSDLVFMMPDQNSAGSVISWIGVPVAGFTGESDRAATPGASNMQITDIRFDVRNGDQQGKLMFQDNELVFESLSDAKHSRHWKYSDIRELTHSDHEIKLQPYHGDKYEFQFKNRAMLDTAYNLISDRVVNARQGRQ